MYSSIRPPSIVQFIACLCQTRTESNTHRSSNLQSQDCTTCTLYSIRPRYKGFQMDVIHSNTTNPDPYILRRKEQYKLRHGPNGFPPLLPLSLPKETNLVLKCDIFQYNESRHNISITYSTRPAFLRTERVGPQVSNFFNSTVHFVVKHIHISTTKKTDEMIYCLE